LYCSGDISGSLIAKATIPISRRPSVWIPIRAFLSSLFRS
jgi:hypothetical protein